MSSPLIAECRLTVEAWFLDGVSLQWYSHPTVSDDRIRAFRNVALWRWQAAGTPTEHAHTFGEMCTDVVSTNPAFSRLSSSDIDMAFTSWCQSRVAQLSLGCSQDIPSFHCVTLQATPSFPYSEVMISFDAMKVRVLPTSGASASSAWQTLTRIPVVTTELEPLPLSLPLLLPLSPPPSPHGSSVKQPIKSHSCQRCASRKQRCIGSVADPCQSCRLKGLECVYPVHSMRGRKPLVPVGHPSSSRYIMRKYRMHAHMKTNTGAHVDEGPRVRASASASGGIGGWWPASAASSFGCSETTAPPHPSVSSSVSSSRHEKDTSNVAEV